MLQSLFHVICVRNPGKLGGHDAPEDFQGSQAGCGLPGIIVFHQVNRRSLVWSSISARISDGLSGSISSSTLPRVQGAGAQELLLDFLRALLEGVCQFFIRETLQQGCAGRLSRSSRIAAISAAASEPTWTARRSGAAGRRVN
jgi:hypothetical protein